jgi:hypothetical protein
MKELREELQDDVVVVLGHGEPTMAARLCLTVGFATVSVKSPPIMTPLKNVACH